MSNPSTNVCCIYCDQEFEKSALTDEHIWPDALGGDALPRFWRTEVCARCNSLSGVFVDGAFIKSWVGAAERATGDDACLATDFPEAAVLPFSYIGMLPDLAVADDEVVDYWAGRCGSSVFHFRPKGEDGLWKTYAGGDPRKGSKRKTAGRAYLSLASPVPFWQQVALSSFSAQFKKALRFRITELEPTVESDLPIPDQNDLQQGLDIAVLSQIASAEKVRAGIAVDPALGGRFQAKLGLAVGYQLFGEEFGKTAYSKALRADFREANSEKRTRSIVRGTGILSTAGLGGEEDLLRWRGGWLLWIKRQSNDTALIVISPSAKVMSVVVSDDPALTASLGPEYDDGVVWVTVPSLNDAVGPVLMPDYIAHQLGEYAHSDLTRLDAKRAQSTSLPDCGLDGELCI